MPFGLCNAPATFQNLMNDIFSNHLDDFITVYLDDIMIFSKTKAEHEKHLRTTLDILRAHKLYAKKSKCEFSTSRVEYLGHIVSDKGIEADPAKIRAIEEWPTPKNVTDIQSFLGLVGFYRRFIKNFSKIAAPMTRLIQKKVRFIWSNKEQDAFDALKKSMTTAPVLAIANPDLNLRVTADASDLALGAALEQINEDGKTQPIAFESKKLHDAELNYPTNEKELFAIVHALRTWRHYLHGRRFTVQTDHFSLKYLETQPNLSKRQARWLETLAEFDFDITYKPGKQNTVADALSRIKKAEINIINVNTLPENDKLEILEAIKEDKHFGEIYKELKKDQPAPINKALVQALKHYTIQNELLLYTALPGDINNERICIPKCDYRDRILYDNHDAPIAGHGGFDKTYELVHRLYYWPGMHNDIEEYVATCDKCQKSKASTQNPIGLLEPLPTPKTKWEQVSLDFITGLPTTGKGYDSILVFVDRLSKRAHFVATKKTVTGEGVARLFFDNIFKHHGLPHVLISDRDPRFTGKFWKTLHKLLGIQLGMSTSNHPQTDGQTERTNRTLEQILRSYVTIDQKNWDKLLTAAEFAYNNSIQASTNMSPFKIDTGQVPRTAQLQQAYAEAPVAEDMVKTVQNCVKIAQDQLQKAQAYQAYYANQRRRHHDFQVGDKVLLHKSAFSDPLREIRLPKLSPYYYGPFAISEKISTTAFKLDIPNTVEIHPVFHTSVLRLYRQRNPDEIPTDLPTENHRNNPDDNLEIERVLRTRTYRRQLQHLIKWKGKPDEEATWISDEEYFERECP
jgi:hypothetical protein